MFVVTLPFINPLPASGNRYRVEREFSSVSAKRQARCKVNATREVLDAASAEREMNGARFHCLIASHALAGSVAKSSTVERWRACEASVGCTSGPARQSGCCSQRVRLPRMVAFWPQHGPQHTHGVSEFGAG
ncbi:hypothetical protein ZHAS_00018666 [Anopheles sinensis]|uniref:Uncharacterized protein n=1 Tax=Anopheles sinensis TaxID=74873 RepID=A0A084WK90_ANOSI|nr:hypothetical protein ZHAS_00018666 [Anopheles sinensis]